MPFPFTPRIVYSTPSFYSLTVGDGSWTPFNAPARVAAAFPRWDGTFLDRIDDTSATAVSYYQKLVVFGTNGVKTVSFDVARFAAVNDTFLYLSDTSLGVNRLIVQIDFTTAIPNIIVSLGALVSSVKNSDGSYTITCTTTAVTAASNNVFKAAPRNGTLAAVGSVYFGNINAWDRPTGGILLLSNSSSIWSPDKQTNGGEATTISGILSRYALQTDALLALTFRFAESEWQAVSDWLDWVMDSGSFGFFDFYPRQYNTEKYTVWLDSPSVENNLGIRRVQGFPLVLELDVVLRTKTNNQLFDVRLSSPSS